MLANYGNFNYSYQILFIYCSVRLDLDAWVEGVGDVAGLSSSSGFPSPLMIPNMSAAGYFEIQL